MTSKLPIKKPVEISKNDNLKGEAADLIINEVENGTKTDLEGNLEVGGEKADVVIANKNGISVNGLKLYNIGELTLSGGAIKNNYKDKGNLFEKPVQLVAFGSDFKDTNVGLNIYSKGFTNTHDIQAKNISITSEGEIVNNKGNIASEESLVLKADKFVNENSALLSSKKDVTIEAKDVTNEASTIYAKNSLVIDANKVTNNHGAKIIVGKGFIRAKEKLTNNISSIKATDGLVIRTPKVENYGQTDFKEVVNDKNSYRRKTRRKESWWKSWYNGYTLDIKTPNKQIVAVSKDATIDSDKHLVITGLAENKKDDPTKLNGNEKKIIQSTKKL